MSRTVSLVLATIASICFSVDQSFSDDSKKNRVDQYRLRFALDGIVAGTVDQEPQHGSSPAARPGFVQDTVPRASTGTRTIWPPLFMSQASSNRLVTTQAWLGITTMRWPIR